MITATANSDGTVSLVGKQGTTWFIIIDVFQDEQRTVPLSLDGYSARGQYRKDYVVTSPVLIEFDCIVLPLDVDTNPNFNKVSVMATPSQSSAVNNPLKGVYDIEVYKGEDIVERIMEGTLEIKPEVTRNA